MRTTYASLLLLFICSSLLADESPSVIKAQSFPLQQVTLLDSPFKKAMEINRAYLLELEPDRLLWPFYDRAGLPTKGDRYGGWEKKDVVGSVAGHYLTACSLMYASTGDQEIKKRVDYVVSVMAQAQAKHKNGYVGPMRPEVWEKTFAGDIQVHKWGLGGGYVPWYVLHKTYAGLIDAYVYAGNKQALDVARKFADWAKKGTDGLTEEQFQKMLLCEYGGMNDAMAILYSITKNKDNLALARRFDHQQIFAPLENKRDELAGQHVNTQMPKIIGAARMYEQTGEQRYATISRFLWDRAVNERSFAPGGIDFHEHFREAGKELEYLNWDSCETCVTYNMLKLTRHLFSWKPDAKLMDYYERALFNHILGSQDPKSGGMTYFYSMKPGHYKTYSTPFDSMWCCVGTGMENHSKYAESIFFHNDQTLWVNLFIPAELEWQAKKVIVRQETMFPRSETTTLTLSTKTPQTFAVKIRVPYWAAGVEVRVNGKEEKVEAKPQSYLTLSREWKDGDKIEVRLPMSLHLRQARDDKQLGTIMFGPLVLAGELGTEGMPKTLTVPHNKQYSGEPVPDVPVFVTKSDDLNSWIKRADKNGLRFQTTGVGKPNDVSLVPLGELHHQRYAVYWHFLTDSQWKEQQAVAEAKRRQLKELEANTVDYVTPDAADERAHHQKGKGSGAGAAFGRKWRDARGGGWFSYEMKVLPDAPVTLIVTYWGGDSGGREFDILVDDKKIATQSLNSPKPGEFVDMTYDIPPDLTKGKKVVTIKFQGHPGRTAGGAFGCRVVRK